MTQNIVTIKRGNCECIATWDCPTPRQSFSALITTPCQDWSRWTYPLPYYNFFRCWYITLRCISLTFNPITLTFDLWPWTFAVYRLWGDETTYQIWSQWSNPSWSYCDFNIWPNDLECHVACCARLSDKNNFHQVWPLTTYPAWIIAFLCWYITSSWDANCWSLTYDRTSEIHWPSTARLLSTLYW